MAEQNIRTASEVYAGVIMREGADWWKQMLRRNGREPVKRDLPSPVYISDNRWVVDCHWCHSAMAVNVGQRDVTCADCGTEFEVVWPPKQETRRALGLLLARRPGLRNWFPHRGQDVAFLKWENDTFGPDHHSYTAPRTWVAGETVTAAIMNTHVRDNLLETLVAKVTTAGDIGYATAANALARLGIGTQGQVAVVNAAATAPSWVTLPSALLLDTTERTIGDNGFTYTDITGYTVNIVTAVRSTIIAIFSVQDALDATYRARTRLLIDGTVQQVDTAVLNNAHAQYLTLVGRKVNVAAGTITTHVEGAGDANSKSKYNNGSILVWAIPD